MIDPIGHDRDEAVYRNILANMGDGVMTLDMDGRIVTFNRGASLILGMAPADVLDRSFAELFIPEPRFEGFNEVVLKAVYERELVHRTEVDVELAGEQRSLSLSTSFLRLEGRTENPPLGIVVVFTDTTERAKRRKLQRIFGEFVDPRILERLLADADRIDLLDQRRTMTVAFCDLAGFTGLAERCGPGALIEFLNGYIRLMTAAVADTDGVTDKIIGDAVMAFWGPPFTLEDPAIAACRCALGQRERLPALRRFASEVGVPGDLDDLEIRIGIASGHVVAGSIGSTGARSYTVVGDTVNVAARLEVANKDLGTRILVNEATYEAAKSVFRFRPMGRLELRGRVRDEAIFALEDVR